MIYEYIILYNGDFKRVLLNGSSCFYYDAFENILFN